MNSKYVTDKACALIRQLHGTSMEAREFSGNSQERVDAVLFDSLGSYLIETKITRSDFLKDRTKPFRKDPSLGIGMYRWYACPEGLIKPEELPEKWGLIWVRPAGKRALMPVGYGGTIQVSGSWGNAKYEEFGSPRKIDGKFFDFRHPDNPKNSFRFDNRDMEKEWSFMFCLARRFKEEVGLRNLK